jgi:hypothetical protein
MIATAAGDISRVFIELGVAVVGLAVLARLANRWGFSAIPLYLLAGLAFGNGGLLPLNFKISSTSARRDADLREVKGHSSTLLPAPPLSKGLGMVLSQEGDRSPALALFPYPTFARYLLAAPTTILCIVPKYSPA